MVLTTKLKTIEAKIKQQVFLRISTRVTGIRILGANHCTTEADDVSGVGWCLSTFFPVADFYQLSVDLNITSRSPRAAMGDPCWPSAGTPCFWRDLSLSACLVLTYHSQFGSQVCFNIVSLDASSSQQVNHCTVRVHNLFWFLSLSLSFSLSLSLSMSVSLCISLSLILSLLFSLSPSLLPIVVVSLWC
jgi:hypothetical protein